jgi:signal transduction histidine kinase
MPTAEGAARRRFGSALSTRLALPFVAVSLLAVSFATALVLLFGDHAADHLVAERHDALSDNLQSLGAQTWTANGGGWTAEDWRPTLDWIGRSGNDVAVLDTAGRVVAVGPRDPRADPEARHDPITVDGARVGTLVVRFSESGVAASAAHLTDSLEVSGLGAAAAAAVLALVVAWSVSRRLTAPLLRVVHSADAMRRGDREVRVGEIPRAPRELRELAAEFDAMADAVAAQERLRRGLVADVAHELRTPVAVLQANVEALVDGVLQAGPEELASLQEEVLRLAARVSDLQALAEADAASVSLQRKECDLGQIVTAVVEQLNRTERAGIDHRVEPAPLWADPDRLYQVVRNLLSNACKFSAGAGPVLVRVWPGADDVWLEVRDQGRGISAADLPHVFERFHRGANSADVPGTGIGLAIVRQLVGAHGGEVSISSSPAVGTTVTVTMPTGQPSAASASSTSSRLMPSRNSNASR